MSSGISLLKHISNTFRERKIVIEAEMWREEK